MDSPQPVDPRVVELQNLQREYRRMEIDRRAYAEQSQAVLRKQQMTIDKFRRENEALKNDIALIMRSSNRPLSMNEQETVQALTDLGDKYANAIEYERNNIATMEEQIEILKSKSLQQRKTMGGVNASKENHYMIQKQIRILENRLDKSLIKFNEASANNKKLRDQIDDLRRERVVFENIYRKLERELADKKKNMAQIIESSNQAYEQRDAFQMEVAAIESANRKEQEEFDEQMAALAHILDTDLQLPPLGGGLGSRAKSLTKLSKSQLLEKASFSPESSVSTSPPRNSRSAPNLHEGLGGTTGGGGAAGEIDYKERVQNFEEAFNKIRAATGISDINALVSTFIKNEEHNFSLFNYVNEQNNEIEKLEEQILLLQEEEGKYKTETGQDMSQHKEILKDLEQKVSFTDSMCEKYELKCAELTRILESLKINMQQIVSKVELTDAEPRANNNNATSALIGDGSSSPGADSSSPPSPTQITPIVSAASTSAIATIPVISEVNMVHYLSLLENKCIQLLQTYTYTKSVLSGGFGGQTPGGLSGEAAQTLVSVLGGGPKIPMGTEHLHIVPPKADDYRSDDDDEERGGGGGMYYDDEDTRPLTREELKFRTLNKLQRKLGGNGGGKTGGGAGGGGGGGGGGDNMGPGVSATPMMRGGDKGKKTK